MMNIWKDLDFAWFHRRSKSSEKSGDLVGTDFPIWRTDLDISKSLVEGGCVMFP
jgi:hypothetical protein